MKKLLTTVLLPLASIITAHASTIIYVDFGDNAGSPATYNTLVPTTSGATTSLEGSGESFTNLLDTAGSATGVDLNVLVTSTGGDVRAGDTDSAHDPVAGIADAALNDGFWVNNGGSNGDVSFVLTFSSLTAAAYDIQLTSGDGVQIDTTWSITTGTGDTNTFIASAGSTSGIGSWSTVAPASGDIVITGTYTATGSFNTSNVNFVSLTAIPEPSSTALLALGGLALTFRRRKYPPLKPNHINMKLNPVLKSFLLLTVFIAAPTHAAVQWLPEDDNISGLPYSVSGVSSWSLRVDNALQGPETDNGFTVNITAVGGTFDMALTDVAGPPANHSARFDFTALTSVSSLTIDVTYDYFASPINPDASPNGTEALAWIKWLGGSDITGDLTLKSPTIPLEFPRFGPNFSTYYGGTHNGGNSITLDPGTNANTNAQAGVYSLKYTSSEGAIAGYTLVVTPDDGGTFSADSRFLHTFDGNFTPDPTPIPEPSGIALLSLGSLAFLARRKR